MLCILLAACNRPDTTALANATNVDELPRLIWAEDLRLGNRDRPDIGFSRVSAGHVDRDGRIYVFNDIDVHLRVYDAHGTELMRLGRKGEGPGEFRNASAVGVAGDTIWVLGRPSSVRLSLFHRDGRHIHTTARAPRVTVPLAGWMLGVILPEFMGRDGLLAGTVRMFSASRNFEESGLEKDDDVRVPRVRFDLHGEIVDTIGWDVRKAGSNTPVMDIPVNGKRYFRLPPPSDEPTTVLMTDGRIVIRRPLATDDGPAIFSLIRIAFSGDTVYDRTFAYMPVGYNTVALDTFARRTAKMRVVESSSGRMGFRRTPEGPDSVEVRRAIRDALDYPQYQPPVQDTWRGSDESLWLRREETGDTTFRWLVLDPQLRPVGVLALPRDMRLLWSAGSEFLAVDLDEFDVPWVVRGRFAPGPAIASDDGSLPTEARRRPDRAVAESMWVGTRQHRTSGPPSPQGTWLSK